VRIDSSGRLIRGAERRVPRVGARSTNRRATRSIVRSVTWGAWTTTLCHRHARPPGNVLLTHGVPQKETVARSNEGEDYVRSSDSLGP